MNLKQLDGRFDADTLIYGDVTSGSVQIVQGILGAFPNLENAPTSLLNQIMNELQVVLHNAIGPDMRMQLIFRSYTNLKAELNEFYEHSRSLSSAEWSLRQRDFHYVRLSQAMHKGYLRSTRAELYLIKQVEVSGNTMRDAEWIGAAKKELSRSLSEVIRGFERASGDARLMNEDDFGHSLKEHFDPSQCGKTVAPVQIDREKSILENCLTNDIEIPRKGRGSIYCNEQYHGFVGMNRLPQATASGCVLPLCNLPFGNYSLVLAIEPVDPQSVIAKEEREIAKLSRAVATSKQTSLSNTVAVKRERIRRLMNGDVRPFHLQFYAHVWEPTKEELEKKLEAIQATFQMLQGASAQAVELPTSCRNVLMACAPGSPYVDKAFRHYTESINLSHLLPVAGNSAYSHTPYQALFNGNNDALHGVNLFEREPIHTFIAGKTGSGKSCLQMELLTQTQPHWDKLVIVDVGFSYATYVKTFPGSVKTLVIEAYGDETLNYLSTEGKSLTWKHCRRATEILTLMAGQYATGDNTRKALIARYVRQFYQHWGDKWSSTSEDDEVSYQQAFKEMSVDEQPTHADFHDWLETKLKTEDDFRDDLLKLIVLLEKWRKDRGGYTLFDGQGTVSLNADVIHFELSKISDVDTELQQVASYVITEWVRSYIMELPRKLGKVAVFEELGAFLQIPGGKALLRDMMERMRKYNCAVLTTIQQVSLLPEDLATSILGNSGQALLLAQKYEVEARALQNAFQLPEASVQNLMRFGAPTPEKGAPFLHCSFSDERRRVVTAYSIASPEMLYVSSTSGGAYDERAGVLAGYDDPLEGIYTEVEKSA